MKKFIYLNDLLHLNNEELDNTKIKFNQWNGYENPMDVYKRNPEEINTNWLLWRTKQRNYNVGQNAVCLLKLTNDTWLFTTIKKITKELNVFEGINYEGVELEEFEQFYGRVIVKYRKRFQTQCRWLIGIINDLEVIHILPSTYDGEDFPGYDNVRLSYSELEVIIKRNRKDWIAALKNQKAIYLITDKSNGKLYVGSAYGENGMLLQRWSNYIKDGHGGNANLREIVDKFGLNYVKENFQYSILENYNSRVDKQVIINRESWWKTTLQSRNYGYNRN